MLHFLLLSVLVSSLTFVAADSCSNPKVDVNSFLTRDATIVSQIAFVAELTLKCDGTLADKPLFAEVDGQLTAVAQVGEGKYQISWAQEIKKSRTGSYNIRLFDEEGFAAARKVQRSGGDLYKVKSFVDVVASYPSAYKGPYLNSELTAVTVATIVAYLAFSIKSKILS